MPRLVLFVESPGFAAAHQAASMAVCAASMRWDVRVVLGLDALAAWAHGRFGEATGPRDRSLAQRANAVGASAPSAVLAEARSLGAKLMACETAARIGGVTPEEARACVDELAGLPSIVALLEGAQAVRF